MRQKIKVFVSYAYADDDLRKQLENHLNSLKQQNYIDVWNDQNISAGRDWKHEIKANLNDAQVILLLVSADFLASEYCYSTEMQQALERHKAEEICVIPIILRSVDWQGTPFSHLQALPTRNRPVIGGGWDSQDEAFTDIVQGIRQVLNHLTTENLPVSSANLPEQDDEDVTSVPLSPRPRPQEMQPQTPSGASQLSVSATRRTPIPTVNIPPTTIQPRPRSPWKVPLILLVVLLVIASSILVYLRANTSLFSMRSSTPQISTRDSTSQAPTSTSQTPTSGSTPQTSKDTSLPFPQFPISTNPPLTPTTSINTNTVTPQPQSTAVASVPIYVFSFKPGDPKYWYDYSYINSGNPIQATVSNTMDFDKDGGSLFVQTHLTADDAQNGTEIGLSFQAANLEGKTASCRIYIETPSPLTANPDDSIYFRPEVRSIGDHIEYGQKDLGPLRKQWITESMAISKYVVGSDADNDPNFDVSQVFTFELLLKTQTGGNTLINNTEFDFYVDDCIIS